MMRLKTKNYVVVLLLLASPFTASASDQPPERMAAELAALVTDRGLKLDDRIIVDTCMSGFWAKGKQGNGSAYEPWWVFNAMRKEFGLVDSAKLGRTYLEKDSKTIWITEVSFFRQQQFVMQAWYASTLAAGGKMCIVGMTW
jgi:hypothetical protein